MYRTSSNTLTFKGGDMMEIGLTAATWAWLLIPMPMLILLSIITYFTEKREDE